MGELGKAVHAFREKQDELDVKIEKNQGGQAELAQKVDEINKEISVIQDIKKATEETQAAVKRMNIIEENTPESKKKELEVYGNALKKGAKAGWRSDRMELTEAETKALQSNIDPQGGYSIMPFFGNTPSEIIFDTSEVRGLASVQTIGTNEYKDFYDDEEAGAGWEGETQPVQDTATPDLGEYSIKVKTMRARPKANEETLEDSSFDLRSWLIRKVSDKFQRLENAAFVAGNVPTQPTGFMTGQQNTATPTDYIRGQVGTLVAGSATAINSDEIIDVRAAMKSGYRANSYFWYNRLTEAELRKLKDGQGNYLWQPSYQMGEPDMLIGQRTAVFEDMPDIAANTLPIGFGDLRRSYLIVDRTGVSVLDDPYTDQPNVRFYIRKRTGGGITNWDSIKYFKMAAS